MAFLGGFYSDDIGYVGKSCKECPSGSFVAFDKAPDTSKQDCKSCPEGNNNDFHCLKSLFIAFRLNTNQTRGWEGNFEALIYFERFGNCQFSCDVIIFQNKNLPILLKC